MSDDADFIARSIDGNGEAFAALAGRHQPALRALLLREMPAAGVDDVAQLTLWQAWRDLRKLKDPERFRAWLFQIARRRCLDAVRGLRRRPRSGPIEAERHRMASPAEATPDIGCEDALAALALLSIEQREAIRGFYLQGLPLDEVARRLGVPTGTIKRRLHEGRQGLRERLGIRTNDSTTKDTKESPMSTITSPGEGCTTLREALAQLHALLREAGRGEFIPLLSEDAVRRAIPIALAGYRELYPDGNDYVDRIVAPVYRALAEHGTWPERGAFDWCVDKPDGEPGINVGIEVEIPHERFAGFSLPVFQVWYGRWLG